MTNVDRTLRYALLFCCLAAFASPAIRAATPDLAAERQAAFADARKASIHGPQTVQLRAQATLALPNGYVFVPQQQAEALLKVGGNIGGPTLLGMVFSEKDDAQWMAVVRYADFNSSTDKVAEYGLAALVGGIAAKKLGLFAMLGVFLLKFWKVALLTVAGASAVFFRKKKPPEDSTPPPAA